MPRKTIGTIEIVTATLLALLTLTSSPRAELYVVAAALFISGHVLIASTATSPGGPRGLRPKPEQHTASREPT